MNQFEEIKNLDECADDKTHCGDESIFDISEDDLL